MVLLKRRQRARTRSNLVKDSERQVRTILYKAPWRSPYRTEGLLTRNARFRTLCRSGQESSPGAIDLTAHLAMRTCIIAVCRSLASSDFYSLVPARWHPSSGRCVTIPRRVRGEPAPTGS